MVHRTGVRKTKSRWSRQRYRVRTTSPSLFFLISLFVSQVIIVVKPVTEVIWFRRMIHVMYVKRGSVNRSLGSVGEGIGYKNNSSYIRLG